MFPIICILRVLLLKEEGNGDKWNKVEELMDNWEEFGKDADLVEELSQVTRFLKEKLGLDWVDERSVARAYGVMKTNAMGVKDQGGQALFPIASLISHNCVSNLEVVGEVGKTVNVVKLGKVGKVGKIGKMERLEMLETWKIGKLEI